MIMDNKKNIVHVEDDVYVVNGKVICFTSDILNMDNPRDVDEVLTLSEVLYVEKGYSAIHGKDTMCVLVKHSDGEHYMISMACIFDLPEDVQVKARAAMDEYIRSSNQIVEIATNVLDKYDIYVVNGKPIGIKHHVWNMDNPEQLDNIVGIAKDLFCVPDMRAIYGEDTICILTHSGGEYCGGKYCRAALGIHDMSGLPADVVKKVKAAMAL